MGGLSMVTTIAWTTNAKLIGCAYVTLAVAFGTSGLVMSWIMRGELCGLSEQLLFGDHQLYNVMTTSLLDPPSWQALSGYAK